MRIPCPATTKAFHDPSYWWLLILVELYAARAANKNGQEGMRVETACYICICKQYTFFVVKAGWLYHLGIFSVIFFFAKAKMTRSNNFAHFSCEVEWLWFKMIQPDMMWIWSNNYCLRFEINHAAATGPPQWTVVMIHVTSSDLWRIWATLRWIQTFLPAKLY